MNCFQKRETICINCENAVPNTSNGKGCSWSRWFKPVEGWKAEPTIVLGAERPDGSFEEIPSYRVDYCPMFASDKDQYAKPLKGKLKKGVSSLSLEALKK